MKRRFHSHPSRASGFTLIEIMIVVVIVAVLAAIAYASYQNLVVKSRRGTAATCLQERAQFMERWRTTRMTYVGADAQLAQCDAAVSRFYTLSFSVGPTATAYTISATPQGIQASRDTGCGTLTLNQQGVRGVSGGNGVAACW